MKTLQLVLVSCFVLSVCNQSDVQAADKPADLILGKWIGPGAKYKTSEGEEYEDQMQVDFRKDGTVTFTTVSPKPTTRPEKPFSATYRWLGDKEIEISGKHAEDGKEIKQKIKIELTKDALTFLPPTDKDQPAKFKRVSNKDKK